jgi:AcrR family transcriptional regulator
MGITERKEKQRLELRKMILDASMKLFVEEGFEKVSVRKIAEIIEYSPTTLYLYFKDKNEILFELCELGFQKMAEYNKDLGQIKNPLLRLHQMGENYLRFGMTYPEYYDLMFIQPAPMEVLRRQNCSEWNSADATINALRELIRECMEQGLIVKDDVNAAAIGVWAMVHGLVSLSIRNRLGKMLDGTDGKDETAAMEKSLHFLLNAIDQTIRQSK